MYVIPSDVNSQQSTLTNSKNLTLFYKNWII